MSQNYPSGDMCDLCQTASVGERSRTEPYGLMAVCDSCRDALLAQVLAGVGEPVQGRCGWAGCSVDELLRALVPDLKEPWVVHWLCRKHFGRVRSDYLTENLLRAAQGKPPLPRPLLEK